jgi:eukaryotic-like serine/threonine-protein kinase
MNFGRYQIENEVGRGSMGVVYRGHDPQIDRTLALKVLRQDRVTSEAFVKRFLKEARAIGRLSHPNIVTVFDVGEDQGNIYIAMEFLEGESLQDVVEHRKLGLKEVVDVVIQVAETLDYAHQKGVVHRDIKPSNIILTPSGQIKITDFGIAHIDDPTATLHTMVGEIMGTPAYMSPQQVLGQTTDGRTDLFSLGVILYELSTGRRPFGGEGKTLATVFNEIVKTDPVEPSLISETVPKEISTIIMKCLGKAPEDRYQTGHELAEALRKTREEIPTRTVVTSDVVVPGPRPKPQRTTAVLILLVAVMALAVGGYFVKEQFFSASRLAAVLIDSSPTGAAIEVNGQSRGNAPATINLPLGSHRIRAVMGGYVDREIQVDLTEPKGYPVTLSLQPTVPLPPKPGVLKVESIPPGAEFYVDGQRRGNTPMSVEVPPGGHQVRVVLAGYQEFSVAVHLKEGTDYPLKADLVRESTAAAKATISIASTPPGAELYLNGKPSGKTPQMLEVSLGWHQVRLTMEGFSANEEHLQLKEAKPYQFNFELKPLKTLDKKPMLVADSDPGGAQVYVNDLFKGKTPLRLRLPPGKYMVRMAYPGYQEWSSQVDLGETGDFPVTGRLKSQGAGGTTQQPPTDKAYLNVQSTPPAAQVFVDGTLKGVTPVKVNVTPGKHRVRVSLAGYQNWEHQVSVKEIKEHPINVFLRQATGTQQRDTPPRRSSP